MTLDGGCAGGCTDFALVSTRVEGANDPTKPSAARTAITRDTNLEIMGTSFGQKMVVFHQKWHSESSKKSANTKHLNKSMEQ